MTKVDSGTTKTSANAGTSNQYKFLIDDCTWHKAFQKARDAGGSPVVIETQEEYQQIINQIETLGLNSIDFRIGARRDRDGKEYHWVNANDRFVGDAINNSSYWKNSMFLDGEPTYKWNGFEEAFLSIYYDDSLSKWVWNDIPDEVYNPGQGQYGYTIEY